MIDDGCSPRDSREIVERPRFWLPIMTRDPAPARGPAADYCPDYPVDGHTMVTHMRGGALVSVRQCSACDWIDFADLDQQVREAMENAGGGHPPETAADVD